MRKSLLLFLFFGFALQAKAQNLVGYTFSNDNKDTKHPFQLELQAFATDGCTKYDDGPPENPTKWQHCCVQHDITYWLGGTELERKTADENLRECVTATGHPGEAKIMYLGTRAGGGPLGHNTYRWGFGWNRVRDYKILSQEELQMAYNMYGENLEGLKKEAVQNKFPIVVPKNYEYVSPFAYSFCEEVIINYLTPKLNRSATVTKFNDYQVSTNYNIRIYLDICEEGIEFRFTDKTDAHTCTKDYSAFKQVNKLDNVKISKKCLTRIKEF